MSGSDSGSGLSSGLDALKNMMPKLGGRKHRKRGGSGPGHMPSQMTPGAGSGAPSSSLFGASAGKVGGRKSGRRRGKSSKRRRGSRRRRSSRR